MNSPYPEDLPKWLWLWLPIVVALFPYVMRIVNVETDTIVFGEQGIIENFTFMVLFIAILLGFLTLIGMRAFPFQILRLWMLILVIGCIYYDGDMKRWREIVDDDVQRSLAQEVEAGKLPVTQDWESYL